jgi:hypothetical protein
MLQSAYGLKGFGIKATDGVIGSVQDLLFDDQTWTTRWLVIDTGSWSTGRLVVLPPSCLGQFERGSHQIGVMLTREQIEQSPALSSHAPVSRQKEREIYDHYGWAPYWSAGLGYAGFPAGYTAMRTPPYAVSPPPPSAELRAAELRQQERDDPHLRSANYVTGFWIAAKDGDIGHVEDFLIEEENWKIRYMVVDTVNWWPGRKVLVAPDWIKKISWFDKSVSVDLLRQKIKDGPLYRSDELLERGYEGELYRHYGFAPYWE